MLTIIISSPEQYDELNNKFIKSEIFVVELEHSLASMSKWESKFEKPFLGKSEKTTDETVEYIKCMVVTPNFDYNILNYLSNSNLHEINKYIDSKQTATTFNQIADKKNNAEVVTSELIYYWMIAFNIPFSCENWHLNRLLTLVRICNVKNSKPKKMSRTELAQRNAMLNAERRARLNSSG